MSGTRRVAIYAVDTPVAAGDRLLARELIKMRSMESALSLFQRHPVLQTVSRRLVWLISPTLVYPYGEPGRMMVEECLSGALQKALFCKGDAVGGFIDGLLQHITLLLEVKISTRAHRWNAVKDEPLMTWLERYPDAIVQPVPDGDRLIISPHAFAGSVIVRLLEPEHYERILAYGAPS